MLWYPTSQEIWIEGIKILLILAIKNFKLKVQTHSIKTDWDHKEWSVEEKTNSRVVII